MEIKHVLCKLQFSITELCFIELVSLTSLQLNELIAAITTEESYKWHQHKLLNVINWTLELFGLTHWYACQ